MIVETSCSSLGASAKTCVPLVCIMACNRGIAGATANANTISAILSCRHNVLRSPDLTCNEANHKSRQDGREQQLKLHNARCHQAEERSQPVGVVVP